MTDNDTASNTAPRKPRTWLRRASVAFAAFVLVLVAGGFGIRLYFNDGRLRDLLEELGTERLGTEVALDRLELRLLSGLTLRGLRIGPPEGFSLNVLTVERVQLSYIPAAVFRGRVHITALEVEGVEVALETNARGDQNISSLLAHLSRHSREQEPASPNPPPSADPPDSRPVPQLPTLPVEVRLDRAWVGPIRARVEQPNMSVDIDQIQVDANAQIRKDSGYTASLWAGLGQRNDPSRRSSLNVERGDSLALSSTQRAAVEVDFAGFSDITLSIRFDAITDARTPIDAPPAEVAVVVDARADLLAATATVERAEVRVGENTRARTGVSLENLFVDPKVRIRSLNVDIALDELAPLVRAVLPPLDLSGTVRVRSEPLSVTLSKADPLPPFQTALRLEAADLALNYGPHRVDALNAELRANASNDRIDSAWTVRVESLQSGPYRASTVQLESELSSPISRWLAPKGVAPNPARLTARTSLNVGRVESPYGAAGGLRSDLRLDSLVDLMRGESVDQPMRVAFTQRIASVTTSAQNARGIALQSDVELWDLAGSRFDSRTRLTVDTGSGKLTGETKVVLPPLRAALTLSRVGQRIRAPVAKIGLGDLFDLDATLDVERVLSRSPKLHKAKVYLAPVSLGDMLALLPPKFRPEQKLAGAVSLDAELSGTLPITRILRAARPPDFGGTLATKIDEAGALLERFATLFSSGLPLSGNIGFELNEFSVIDAAAQAKGLSVDADLDLFEDGPQLELAALVGEVNGPARLQDLRANVSLGFRGRSITSRAFFELARYEGAYLPKPLRDAHGEWGVSYDVGGAFEIDTLVLEAPDRDGQLSLSFLIQDPLRIVRNQSYALPGMPGVDATARLSSTLRVDEAAPLEIPGVELEGGFGLNGEARIADGFITLSGVGFTKHLSLKNAAATVTDIDGGLPFEFRLATRPVTGFVPLPQPVIFGGGTLRIENEREGALADVRPLYFPRTRRYRRGGGVKIRRIESQGFTIEHLELDGGLRDAAIIAERARLSILGGDIEGSMAMGISGKRSVAGTMELKLSNIDASYFPELDLEPGPDSEVDADAAAEFEFAEDRRDLTMNMNVTRMSSTALDRFLQLLDPKEENPSIQSTRFWLDLAQINEVAVWLAYENLNMDLDANSIIKIPYTSYGFPSFERELLRREPMSERLDVSLDPLIRKVFGPLVGVFR